MAKFVLKRDPAMYREMSVFVGGFVGGFMEEGKLLTTRII